MYDTIDIHVLRNCVIINKTTKIDPEPFRDCKFRGKSTLLHEWHVPVFFTELHLITINLYIQKQKQDISTEIGLENEFFTIPIILERRFLPRKNRVNFFIFVLIKKLIVSWNCIGLIFIAARRRSSFTDLHTVFCILFVMGTESFYSERNVL